MLHKRLLGCLAAVVVFLVSACLLALATPFLVMALSGCLSFHDSCADSAGWAWLIAAPLSIPMVASLAAGCAIATYLWLTRSRTLD